MVEFRADCVNWSTFEQHSDATQTTISLCAPACVNACVWRCLMWTLCVCVCMVIVYSFNCGLFACVHVESEFGRNCTDQPSASSPKSVFLPAEWPRWRARECFAAICARTPVASWFWRRWCGWSSMWCCCYATPTTLPIRPPSGRASTMWR